MYYDILINLLASALWVGMGIIVNKAITKWKDHSKTAIWRLVSSQDTIAICLSIREGPKPSSTARTSVAEVSAVAELIPILKKLEQKYELVIDDADTVLRHYKKVISIGGPQANIVTRRLLEKYQEQIPVKILNDPFGFEIGTKKYTPVYSDDNTTVKTDYALLLCIKETQNNNDQKMRIIAVGCRGYGTQGCISCIQSNAMIDVFKKHHRPNSFIAIIKIDIDGHKLNTHIEQFFPIQT